MIQKLAKSILNDVREQYSTMNVTGHSLVAFQDQFYHLCKKFLLLSLVRYLYIFFWRSRIIVSFAIEVFTPPFFKSFSPFHDCYCDFNLTSHFYFLPFCYQFNSIHVYSKMSKIHQQSSCSDSRESIKPNTKTRYFCFNL